MIDLMRSYRSIAIDEKKVRHRVVLEDLVETPMHSISARNRQATILKALADTPDLIACGPVIFDSMKVWHDGARWRIEAEAVAAQ